VTQVAAHRDARPQFDNVVKRFEAFPLLSVADTRRLVDNVIEGEQPAPEDARALAA
jgi:hypothetical protein